MTERNPEKHLSIGVFITFAVIIVIIWAGTGFLLYDATAQTPTLGDRGTFGDMFGAVNALFSGLAFAGIIFTVLLQREELRLQRGELAETRRVMDEQRAQLEAQSETFVLQRFEGTFFLLLPHFSRIAEAAGRYKDAGEVANALGFVTREISQEMPAHLRFEDAVSAGYRTVLNNRQFPFLPRYFRSLYSVLSFIDRGSIGDRQFYANLIRNELSVYECTLLAYIGLSDVGRPKLKPLIERYRLLKNIPNQHLFDNLPLFNAYDRSAFSTDLPSMLNMHTGGSLLEELAAAQPPD